MDSGRRVEVSASRQIAAPATEIFRVLAAPANHPAHDGSGMLRAVQDQPMLRRVGDTCTEAAQSIRDAVQDGQDWIPAMHQTLERLAALVERT